MSKALTACPVWLVLAVALAGTAAPARAEGLSATTLAQAQALAPAQVAQPKLQPSLHLAPAAPDRVLGLARGTPWGGQPALAGLAVPAPAGAHPAHAYPASAWQPAHRAHWPGAPLRSPGVGGQADTTAPAADELQLRLSFKTQKPHEHLRGGQLVRLDLGAATALSLRPRGGRVLVQLHSRW